MKELSVKVQSDYLERMVTVKNPVLAVAELIWNSLDAEASRVEVTFSLNALDGAEKITVVDNGHGMDYEEVTSAFEKLGGSWKKYSTHSKGDLRRLHGKRGQGRFQAFSLGEHVSWHTCYMLHRHKVEYTISGRRARLGVFTIDDNPKQAKDCGLGTTVVIEGVDNGVYSLITPKAVQTITEQFALYLRQYPDVGIYYQGHKINPADAEERLEEYTLDDVELDDGRVISSKLTVIEWKAETDRVLYLCDSGGFALSEIKPGIQAPGFDFTAYLKSDYFKELDEQNLLMEDFHPPLKKVVANAKGKLKDHFRKRAAENASKIVEEWKEEKIYPYEGVARNIIEETERQVFDVVALSLHDYLPDFEATNNRNKKFAFALLKQAIEESPKAVQRILEEVLELPKEKQEEFAQLLERTSLTAIINASKVVADRLDFLRGLELLVFDPQSKQQILERRQLHKILNEQTWIFGEEFNLTLSDKSLNDVLNKHLQKLGRGPEEDGDLVLREDGSKGIVDLMLSRVVPQPRAEEREHLIVELKRPSQKIDPEVAGQIKSYAFAVADDERFRDTKTRWVFWAISNEISDSVRREANQRNRPRDLLFEDEEERIFIWVKTWGQLIESCRARLEFFQRELNYSVENESALAYLRKVHSKYLPPVFADEVTTVEAAAEPAEK
jgi:hypothetical protein